MAVVPPGIVPESLHFSASRFAEITEPKRLGIYGSYRQLRRLYLGLTVPARFWLQVGDKKSQLEFGHFFGMGSGRRRASTVALPRSYGTGNALATSWRQKIPT